MDGAWTAAREHSFAGSGDEPALMKDTEGESSKSAAAIETIGEENKDDIDHDAVVSEQRRESENAHHPHKVKRSRIRRCLEILKDQWFTIALGLVIAIASQGQVPLKYQERKRTLTSYICVSLIFFVTGCILDTKILLRNYAKWKIHLYTQTLC